MGNVHASSQGITSTLTPTPVPQPASPPITSQSKDTSSQDEKKEGASAEDLFPNNPGSMEDLHKKCKGTKLNLLLFLVLFLNEKAFTLIILFINLINKLFFDLDLLI